jgi:putative selenate reductase molybdopterin-binding subunit
MSAVRSTVGKSFARLDSIGLVTGRTQFTDDIHVPGLLYGRILSSPYAHARIRHIDCSKARRMAGVHAVLNWNDVPRVPHTTAGQAWPEPSPYDTYMFDSKVRFVGDRVAAVAAETKSLADEAVERIEVEYECLSPVLDAEFAMAKGAPVIHDESDSSGIYDAARNIAGYIHKHCGCIEKGFAESDFVLEREYRTQRVQHCSIEPHVTITWLDGDGRLVVRTSTQVPYHIRRQVAMILRIPVSRLRVVAPPIGGGFGGKQELVLEDVCAALTLATSRPVKIEYTRHQEFIMARTRHPQILKLKIGTTRNGSLRAIDFRVIATTGAYGSHGITVQGSTGSRVLALYRVPHLSYEAHVVYTNTPVAGAFRGYGCPQGFFALESHLDEISHELHIDPVEIRRRNLVQIGDIDFLTFAGELDQTGWAREIRSCGLEECLQTAARDIAWVYQRPARVRSRKRFYEGLGLACAMQGSGVAGVSWSSAVIRLTEDGSFVVSTGALDIGTGSHTVLAQIAAEELSVSLDKVIVESGSTDSAPFNLGTYASSTTTIAGGAIKKAAEALRGQIIKAGAEMLRVKPKELVYADERVALRRRNASVSLEEIGRWSIYTQKQQITASASHSNNDSPPPFCAQFAKVRVDSWTGKVYVKQLVTALDCGFAINPALTESQVEGAVAQGLGYALTEELQLNKAGSVVNPSFKDYKIFSAKDMPNLRTFLIRTDEPLGPYGAKAAAEVAINGVAPAIANAIFNATGVRVRELPISPEKLFWCLRKRNVGHPAHKKNR